MWPLGLPIRKSLEIFERLISRVWVAIFSLSYRNIMLKQYTRWTDIYKGFIWFSSHHRQEGHSVLLNSEPKDWMWTFRTVTNKHLNILFVPFQFRSSIHMKEWPKLPGRSCSIRRTLRLANRSVSSLCSVSSLAAKHVYELLKKNCKRWEHTERTCICPIMPSWGSHSCSRSCCYGTGKS